MDPFDDIDDEPKGFGERYGSWIAGVAAIAALGVALAVLLPGKGERAPPRKIHEVQMVKILPPPPPPPPPPPQPQQQVQQKMVEQPQMKMPEIKQENPPPKAPKPDQPPPGPLGLDAKGEGPGDAFGLAGRPGGGGLLGGSGEGGGGAGSRWGWYASMVQTQIEDALRSNRKTRNAQLRVVVRLWSDAQGRIERVQLASSSGSAEIDAAIENEVLVRLQLKEPPPKDMPMPIVMRVTERRPS